MAEEIKFPFEPCEEVKAAFRQRTRLERSLELIVEALLRTSADMVDPWAIVRKHHPELAKANQGALAYNNFSETLDLRIKP